MVKASYEPFGLEPIETASRDEIAALQTERLKWSLHHAYSNVPTYREKLNAAGVHPDDFRRLEDLARFPFTTKQDLRENYPFGMFAVARERIVRIHASSGTTGKPSVVGYTQRDINTWSDLMARSIRASGGRPGMIVHVAYGYGLFTGGLGVHYGAERLGCTVVPVSGGMTERQVQLIEDFRPDIIMVTPSYMLAILDGFRAKGLDPTTTSLKIGIFGAEPWTNAMRSEIEAAFALDAVDIYGLSEVMGPGVANECVETKDGPHVWEDHFYPEIIDPQTGAVLPDGEHGELVFTSLTKEGMPVIRYRTRDLTRLQPGTARSMRRMDRITGRSDDMMIVRGVNVFPTQLRIIRSSCAVSSGLTSCGSWSKRTPITPMRPPVPRRPRCWAPISATRSVSALRSWLAILAGSSVPPVRRGGSSICGRKADQQDRRPKADSQPITKPIDFRSDLAQI
jgi:phenylacetate-CoA ligase